MQAYTIDKTDTLSDSRPFLCSPGPRYGGKVPKKLVVKVEDSRRIRSKYCGAGIEVTIWQFLRVYIGLLHHFQSVATASCWKYISHGIFQ